MYKAMIMFLVFLIDTNVSLRDARQSKCVFMNNNIQLLTGFEDNSSFVWPENWSVRVSNKTAVVREACLLLFCYTPSFFQNFLSWFFFSNRVSRIKLGKISAEFDIIALKSGLLAFSYTHFFMFQQINYIERCKKNMLCTPAANRSQIKNHFIVQTN